MYSLSNISLGIRIYELKQILESGQNDMFGNKIDKAELQAEIDRLQKIYDGEEKVE